MYYGPRVLEMIGFTNGGPQAAIWGTIPLATLNMLGTVVAVFYIDKVGRRLIMLRTLPGIAISLLGIAAAFYIMLYQP
jgi:hypothetical protein